MVTWDPIFPRFNTSVLDFPRVHPILSQLNLSNPAWQEKLALQHSESPDTCNGQSVAQVSIEGWL